MSSTINHPCRLLQLPAELRLAIYELAFPCRTVHISVDKNVYRWRSFRQTACMSLLGTCKTINNEASPIFHNNTTVHFSIWDEFERLLSRYYRFSSLESFDAASFNHVRKISLSLHTLTEPTFSALHDHTHGLLQRLGNCAEIRSLQIHFEIWSNTSDQDLHRIYDTLSEISFAGPVEIGTCMSGSWITLYHAKSFQACFHQLQIDMICRKEGLPLFMEDVGSGAEVGPRELIIASAT